TVIPIIISVFAVLVSAASMWISLLTYRRSVRKERPFVSRSTHGWQCDDIRFRTWGARGISYIDAHASFDTKTPFAEVMKPLPIDRAKKYLTLNMSVGKAGGSCDSALFVFVPARWWNKTLFMRGIAALSRVHPADDQDRNCKKAP